MATNLNNKLTDNIHVNTVIQVAFWIGNSDVEDKRSNSENKI